MTSSKRERATMRGMFGRRSREGLGGAGEVSGRQGSAGVEGAPTAPADRAAVIARLKSRCLLAQGFCLVGLILCALLLVGVGVRLASVVTGTSVGEGGRTAPPIERLYLYGDDGKAWTDTMGASAGEFGGAAQATRGISATVSPADTGSGAQAASGMLITNDSAPIVGITRDIATLGLLGAVLWVGARFFGRIAKSGEPFRPERARELSIVAGLLIVLAVLPGLLELGALLVGVILLPDASYDITFGLFNYVLFAGAMLLLAFARAFAYGCLLQQQDDELV